MQHTQRAIDNFIKAYSDAYEEKGMSLLAEYDGDWPSQCCVGQPYNADGRTMTEWQPVLQTSPLSFSKLEESLSFKIDEQYKVLFSRYWSDNLNAKSARGNLQILQVWSEEDAKRLQSNLIAHVLMKRRLKQRETLFFAVTDEEDFTLSILNDTGEVVLEQVGCEPTDVIAPNLAEFISNLEPVVLS